MNVPDLRVPKCRACGELLFDNDADEQIERALRQKLGLLLPEEIQRQRQSEGLTQTELAARLGVAPETICRWESGTMVQSRAMDRYLRVYFTFPDVRTALADAVAFRDK